MRAMLLVLSLQTARFGRATVPLHSYLSLRGLILCESTETKKPSGLKVAEGFKMASRRGFEPLLPG